MLARAFGVGAALAMTAGANGTGYYLGPQLPAPTGHATFDLLPDGEPLAYVESGLSFEVDGVSFKSTRIGLDGTDNFYPGGGADDLITIRRVDGAPMPVLQMQVSDGFQTTAVYVWGQTFANGTLVGSFDVDLAAGMTVGFIGPFDELRIGAYINASTRNEHDPQNHNALALDNVCFGSLSFACLCEFTNDNCVDLLDLLAFLAHWFPREAVADVNASGDVRVSDLLDFLECWYDAQQSICGL